MHNDHVSSEAIDSVEDKTGVLALGAEGAVSSSTSKSLWKVSRKVSVS